MANNGIEDILIGEAYNTTKKKKKKGPIILCIILLIVTATFAGLKYYMSKDVAGDKELFLLSLSNKNSKKLVDQNFYSTLLDRFLQENSEMTTNMTISSTEKFDKLNGIDVNNFDFELTSQNNLKEKNFYGELFINYSGNEFLNFKGIVNNDKFAIISDDIVNKYVGVKAQNFNNIFESNIDLNFIYEFINAEKIDLTEEERKNYLNEYYTKIYIQIPEEKFSKKENIVITKNDKYIDVTAYEMKLNQSELNDIIVNVLNKLKEDEKLLNSIVSKDIVQLDLSENEENQENIDVQEENKVEEQEELESGDEGTSLQLTPVSEVNFQTAEVLNEGENSEDTIEETEENVEETDENVEEVLEENIENEEENQEEGLQLQTIEEDEKIINKDFTTSDFIKILLGRKINVSQDKIIEKIDEYIQNLEGNGLTVTIYVSEEKTEKISLTMPNENKIDIQFLENTEKENTVEVTYLYKNSNYKNGITFNIDEVHNSASSSIKIVKNYIEDEKINKKVTFSVQTDGTKNAKTLSNDIVLTISSNSDETKLVAENKIKFVSKDLILEKLSQENSVFLDDLQTEEREKTIQAIKDKIDVVLADKKEKLNLIDLNSGNSIVGQNLTDMTTNNYLLIKGVLENKINELRNQAEEKGEEFTLQNLQDLYIDGFEVSSNVDEDKAVVVIDIYTFTVDRDFNISDT